MATFTDDFNRANGAPGVDWTTVGTSSTITSNQLVVANAGDGCCSCNKVTSTDHYFEFTLVSGGKWPTTMVRGSAADFNSNATNRYNVEWRESNTLGTLFMYKYVGSTETDLGSQVTRAADGSVVRLTINGSTLTAYDDTVSMSSVTDTSITTGTWTGIKSNTACTVDNATASDLGGAPAFLAHPARIVSQAVVRASYW